MTFTLNDEQALAAECLDRPVLVTAGAGSGKTRMLTERYVNAVVEGRVPGWQPVGTDAVVAITFTEKAAGEIAERVREELRARGDVAAARDGNLWISTIHGLCSRLLRRHPFEAGVDPLFRVADTVTAGRLREQSFEAAVEERRGEDENLLELLDLYGFAAVFSAVKNIARELAVAGLDPEEIELEPVRPVSELQNEVLELFQSGTTTCEAEYRGKSEDPVEHSRRCEAHFAECTALVSSEPSERELLEGLTGELMAYRPVKNLKGLEEIHDVLLQRRQTTLAAMAAALVAPFATTLKALTQAYVAQYRGLKEEVGVLDFEDLQVKAVDLLTSDSGIARDYREQFDVVMIDEFQDTDALQLRLVKALSSGNLCTVGDDMQSIYRFRGADVDVYRQHRTEMEADNALVVELATNYRSHPDILGFVNEVFDSPEYEASDPTRLKPAPAGRGTQGLDACLGETPRVEALFIDAADAAAGVLREAREIAQRLEQLRARGMHPGDVAVLLRSYTQAHVYANALTERGIPASVVGGSRFFELSEIAIMRALTRVIANVDDDVAMGVLLASDFVPISEDALVRCRLAAEPERVPLWEMVDSVVDGLSDADRQAIDRLVQVVEDARERVGRDPLEHILMRAVEEAGWDLRLVSGGNMGLDAFANVMKFVRRAASFEANEGSGPAGFSAYLEAKERFGDGEAPASVADDGSDAVRIMSIHASKGLEFPVVVVPRLASSGRNDSPIVRVSRSGASLKVALKTYPLSDTGAKGECSLWFDRFARDEKASETQENDRVLYVAFTRARDLLMVSGAANLHPKKESTSKSHLVRLARILGLAIPVGGPSDQVIDLAGSVPCRVRVVQTDTASPVTAEAASIGVEASPPYVGAPLVSEMEPPSLPQRLSYTQLSEFAHCPRHFHIRRVMGIRPLAVVVPGRADPLRFGNALHAALRLIGAQGDPPSPTRIGAIARYFELDERMTVRLSESVMHYCESDIASRVLGAETVMREAPLTLMIGGNLYLLTGSIDLYATSDDSALIVDYKSGITGDSAHLEDRYRLQADCYALAALRDGRRSVEVVFVRPEVVSNGDIERVSFVYRERDAETIEADLVSRYHQIEESAYPPRPGESCRQCEVPLGMCEYRSDRPGGA